MKVVARNHLKFTMVPNGKIDFNGTEEDWIKMRDAMVDVIQSGTGKGIKGGLQYSVAGKTGTAQVKKYCARQTL